MPFPSHPLPLLAATTALVLGTTAAAATATASSADVPHLTTAAAHHEASPGAESAGDRLFPVLGNGGYDVRDYDLSLTYQPDRTTMPGTVILHAVATQTLSEFSLDSVAQQIRRVRLDGRPVPFRLDPKREKLVITGHVHDHAPFVVRVDYVADRSKNPAPPTVTLPPGVPWPLQAWVNTPDGFAVMGQPDRSHIFFPSNDHPSDKARFTVRITAPSDRTAISGGRLLAKYRHDGATTWVYRTAEPIPTDVLQIAVGKFREVKQTGPHGLPVRSYVTLQTPDGTDLAGPMERNARETPAQLAWIERQLGRRFPFERYGVLGVASAYNGVALETATLSTFGAHLSLPPKDQAAVMVHELTHQYFGDAVSVHSWDDMWISEGHARYYQALYAADRGLINLEAQLKSLYQGDQQLRDDSGPMGRIKRPTSILLSTDNPGALMLAGLRTQVGDRTFRRIEQTFYDRYRGRSASTADYIAVANRVSGRNLTPYFDGWLYSSTTPPMPGHPDWHSPK